MLARVILIPVQIWSDPVWWQFVGDTLPEMIFASAWSLMVTFFVQLVGIAIGVGTSTAPGIVIQATVRIILRRVFCFPSVCEGRAVLVMRVLNRFAFYLCFLLLISIPTGICGIHTINLHPTV